MPAELGPSKRLEIWGFQGPRCATIGWRPPIVPFLVVPRNGRATKSQPELARLALRFWQRRSLASISISISICILRQHQPTIKRFPPAGRSLPPSPPSPLLLDATRSPFAPTPILCFSQLRLGQTVTAVIPSTAQVSWHLLADLEVDPWRPSFCPRRPSSTSLLVVRIQARGLGSRNITVGRCLPDSPTPPLSLPPPQRCLIPQSPPSPRPN